MKTRIDKVLDEIGRQSAGLIGEQYAEFLRELARGVNIMASYASGNEGRPTLAVVNPASDLVAVFDLAYEPEWERVAEQNDGSSASGEADRMATLAGIRAVLAARSSAGAPGDPLDYKLPCEVRLPPATTFGVGVSLRTVVHALQRRTDQYPPKFNNSPDLSGVKSPFQRPGRIGDSSGEPSTDYLHTQLREWWVRSNGGEDHSAPIEHILRSLIRVADGKSSGKPSGEFGANSLRDAAAEALAILCTVTREQAFAPRIDRCIDMLRNAITRADSSGEPGGIQRAVNFVRQLARTSVAMDEDEAEERLRSALTKDE